MKMYNFENSVVLVTGGTGSFGKALVKKLVQLPITEIRILSRDETKQESMRRTLNDPRIKFFIGDVKDASSLKPAMSYLGVAADYIFHAAALKQVPSCEFFPFEALKTNVIGTQNVLELATFYGVKKTVCLSTDKAVYPINAMGMSKAMMEKIVIAHSLGNSANGSIFCCTRYGNVMASRGSVLPLFADIIRGGGIVPITNPEMTRFMMSLEDAIDLVLYAFSNGEQGEIMVQKAPAATVGTIANVMLEIFEEETSQVQISGSRHGEKIHETLVAAEEFHRARDLPGYFNIQPDSRDLNYGLFFDGQNKVGRNTFASDNTYLLDSSELKVLFSKAGLLDGKQSEWFSVT
jgi:UDP-glucose 4-epimerase